ncbi:SH3 domain-containing protein, partial [Streptococcus entericus]|uniref:SH3 domain-containing protein n=1 Tax=Streptococcus entericus TaxID=155680 RepID=UPI000477EAC6
MKNQRKKFYLTIPVFLGMLLASGKVAANETSVEQPPVPPTTEPSQATTITPAESSTVSETTPTAEASPAIAVRAAVETSATTPASQVSEESLPSSGTYTFTERVGVKSEPKMSAPDRDYYTAGEKANYDKTVENDNHLWISYVSYSGSRSYVPVKELGTPTASTPTETAKPVAEKALAKVEVVGYDEYKTNFTIKVTGTPDTKQIAHV